LGVIVEVFQDSITVLIYSIVATP